jgi:AraC family chitin signaling transcriptional activator
MSGGELHEIERRKINRVHMQWPLYQEAVSHVKPTAERVGRSKEPAPSSTLLHSESHPSIDTKHEQWLRTVRALVEEHYSDPDFTTSSAAKRLYMSERSLQRRFKAAFLKTFTDYITEFRLEKACEMLLLGDKIADVAFSCGFNDPSYFSQKFKLHFGVSPSKFAILESDLNAHEHD